MWWNAGPHLQRRIQIESGQHLTSKRVSKSFFQTDTDADEFRAILVSKYGSITRAWRNGLDSDSNGYLDFCEFCRAARTLGITGHLRTLWFNLDVDDSGTISLFELDQRAATVLEKFRAKSTSKYDSIHDMWTKCLDQDGSKTVSYAEFEAHVGELGYHDDDERWELFNLLVRPGSTLITFEDIAFLQKWEDKKREQVFRKRVNCSWVNKDPFIRGRLTLPSIAGGHSRGTTLAPSDSSDSFGTWTSGAAAEEDYSAVVGTSVEKQKEDFKRFLLEKFGSLPRAFDAMDANRNGYLSLNEFQTHVCTVLRYCRYKEASRLFLAFNKNADAMLTWNELGIDSSEWTNYNLARQTARIRQRQHEIRELATAPAPLASSPRQCTALTRHVDRVRRPAARTDISFCTPRPKGWGVPPDFDPHGTVAAPPFTAR